MIDFIREGGPAPEPKKKSVSTLFRCQQSEFSPGKKTWHYMFYNWEGEVPLGSKGFCSLSEALKDAVKKAEELNL